MASRNYLFSGETRFMKRHLKLFSVPGVQTVSRNDEDGILELVVKCAPEVSDRITEQLESKDTRDQFGGCVEASTVTASIGDITRMFREGKAAAMAGHDIDSCRYRPDSYEHREWLEGHVLGMKYRTMGVTASSSSTTTQGKTMSFADRIVASSGVEAAPKVNLFLGPNSKLVSLTKDPDVKNAYIATFKVLDDHIEFNDVKALERDIKKAFPGTRYFALSCKGKTWSVFFNSNKE